MLQSGFRPDCVLVYKEKVRSRASTAAATTIACLLIARYFPSTDIDTTWLNSLTRGKKFPGLHFYIASTFLETRQFAINNVLR